MTSPARWHGSVVRNDGALAHGVGNREHGWSRRRGALLVLRDGARVGLGEASPLPGYSVESLEDCVAALEAVAGRLEAPDAGPSIAARVAAALARADAELRAVPAARFAVESALFDLLARDAGQSVAEALRGGAPRARVARSGLLGDGAAGTDLVAEARALVARGVRTVKAKIGRADPGFERELAALARLRDALGDQISLRLDANGAWDVRTAQASLERLAALRPDFVEEPVRGAALLNLGVCAVPWAADESLADPALRAGLIEAPGCAAVVLKPALLGGLRASLELARHAQSRGLGVVVTHLFDGPVGLAAACELALALPDPPLACGLDAHAGLGAWSPVALPQLREPGCVVAGPWDGLGLALAEVAAPVHTP